MRSLLVWLGASLLLLCAAAWSLRYSVLLALLLAVSSYAAVAARWPAWGRLFRGMGAEVRVGRILESAPGVVAHSVKTRAGDADHVVVSFGACVVETKSVSGAVSVRNGQLLVNGRELRSDPLAQARKASELLAPVLGVKPAPVVCLARTRSVSVRCAGVLVVSPDRLLHEIAQLPALPAKARMVAAHGLEHAHVSAYTSG